MILANRLIFVDCGQCGHRFLAKRTEDKCPECGHSVQGDD